MTEKLSPRAIKAIDSSQLYASPLVLLELDYLYQKKRIAYDADKILFELNETVGLRVANSSFADIIAQARQWNWTRDPFDLIITAEAAINNASLITADKHIRKHYKKAIW